MNNAIESLLPTAIEAVEKFVLDNNKKVPSEFNGYISSFGASMITSGLLQTIVFYSQEGKGKGNRTSVIHALEYIIHEKNQSVLHQDKKLLDKVMEMVKKNIDTSVIEDKLMDSALALKLAIRIFPKSEKK